MSKLPSPQQMSEYFAQLGRKGGKARTPKKIRASRKSIAKARQAMKKLFPKDSD